MRQIRAESALGAGTTFVVSLPRGRAHLPEDRIGAARALSSLIRMPAGRLPARR